MRFRLAFVLSILLWGVSLRAQTANTVITGTITNPDGSTPSGTLTLSWQRNENDATPRQVIFPGRSAYPITNGIIPNISLFPNTAMSSPGSCYTASYVLNGQNSTRFWYVFASATPLNYTLVEGGIPCPTQSGVVVAAGQIQPGPAGQITVLTSTGASVPAWLPGGGGGGSPLFSSILTGTNNSGQVLTIGSTTTLTYSGTGINNANRVLGVPIVGLSGNSGSLVQGSGAFTNGDLAAFDPSGNVVDSNVIGPNVILNTGSYLNPAWIASLSASKVTTGTLPCAQLPATTGDVTQSAGSCATLVLGTNGTPFAASATTDTTNAANVTIGVFGSARIPAINLASSGAGGVTGNLQIANFNGGTGAGVGTYWGGDALWHPITSGGTVTNTAGPLSAGYVAVGNGGSDLTVLGSQGLTTQTLHATTGGSPTWALINLFTDVTGTLAPANGGTGSPFIGLVGATGPRNYLLPDASTTILTTNTAVTMTQGGTGANFSSIAKGGILGGTGAGTMGILTVGTNGKVLTANSAATDGFDWEAVIGTGTVTGIACTAPISCSPSSITTTGTLSGPTIVTSATAETLNQLVIGQGSQATAVLGSLGTTTTLLHGNAAGPPSFGQVVNGDIANATIDLTAKVTNVLPFANAFPSGSQTQYLTIKPNVGNSTTIQWESLPEFNVLDYNFPIQTPGGSLTAGTRTISLSPCPLGVAGTDTLHYLYISGGTGTAEAVPIVGGTCTSGASSGNVQVTVANSHSGAWTIQSGTSGITEAMNAATAAGGGTVHAPYGIYPIYGPIYSCQNTLTGDGPFDTILQIQTASGGGIDAPCQKDHFASIGITTLGLTPGSSGSYAIRLGNGSGHDNAFTTIDDIYIEPLYDAILCINCSQTKLTRFTIYNFYHTGGTFADVTNPDNDGPTISDGTIFNFNSYGTAALAGILATSTGGITIDNVNIYGTHAITAPEMQYNIDISQTASTQVALGNCVLETASVTNVLITGVFNLITMHGCTVAQPQVAQNGWRGLDISGNNTTSSCGTGIGICSYAITGNVFQGPGPTSTNSAAVDIEGFATQGIVAANAINYTQIGVNIGSNVTTSMVATNQISAYSSTISGGSSTVTWVDTGTVSFSQLPTAANGSVLFTSDANSGCTAGSSTGRRCQRAAGAWTN